MNSYQKHEMTMEFQNEHAWKICFNALTEDFLKAGFYIAHHDIPKNQSLKTFISHLLLVPKFIWISFS